LFVHFVQFAEHITEVTLDTIELFAGG